VTSGKERGRRRKRKKRSIRYRKSARGKARGPKESLRVLLLRGEKREELQ